MPKNPQEVWADQWNGWDDWLGVPWKDYEVARGIAQRLPVQSRDAYLAFVKDTNALDDDDDARRLPYRPDLYYKTDWKGWEDFLGT